MIQFILHVLMIIVLGNIFYIDYKRDKLSANLKKRNANIKKHTDHNSLEEWNAYDKGRADEETVITEWIEKWDGKTNSGMGQILTKKFHELYEQHYKKSA